MHPRWGILKLGAPVSVAVKEMTKVMEDVDEPPWHAFGGS